MCIDKPLPAPHYLAVIRDSSIGAMQMVLELYAMIPAHAGVSL